MEHRVLFWDFDGTLGYRLGGMWSSALHEALLDAEPDSKLTVHDFAPLLKDGFPWHQPDQEHTNLTTAELWWSNLISTVIAKAYRSLGYSAEDACRLASIARQKYVDSRYWALYDDVIPLLHSLKEKGWKHIIVSNHVPELHDIISSLGLSGYVSDIVNSALIGYEKPHPQIYQIALERAGNPKNVWMIGDNIDADVIGAEKAGIKGILVRKEDARAARQCKSLSGITAFLES
jgi:putative hydrolase of the HAD superfamily